jgi:Mn-dependent DtxR family transcriptional regulator
MAVFEINTREASSIEVFRQWVEDGLTSAEDISREMGVSKGTVSKMAKRAMKEGWLKKQGREYVLV